MKCIRNIYIYIYIYIYECNENQVPKPLLLKHISINQKQEYVQNGAL